MNVILKRFDVKNAISNASKKVVNTPFFATAQKFATENKLAVKITSYLITITLVIYLAAVVTGVRFGFKVEYNGKVIATVANEEVSKNAVSIAHKSLSKDMSKLLSSPKLSLTITFDDRLDSENELADNMISSTDEIIKASALVVNDEYKAFAKNDELNNLLDKRLNEFNIDGVECKSEFVDKVEIKDDYFLEADFEKGEDIKEIVSTLNVKTTFTKNTKVTIPFTTKEVDMPTKSLGYRKVTTAGKNGVAQKSVRIEMVNGKVLKKTLLYKNVVTEPVVQVVAVGTSKKYMPNNNQTATSAGFICPISRGSYVISAYWGDGRNHKAIDFAAPYGTSIYAAAAGKVVYAGWDNDYGYNVIIDHGNGIRTRYAHASRLFVRNGARVDRGQVIAAVGSTGYSTGNHLHFEVIVRGVRVNPAPYIGL